MEACIRIVSRLVLTSLCLVSMLSVGSDEPSGGEDIKQFDIYIEQREIKPGLTRIVVSQGQWVKLVWHSDEDVDIHLHGYDLQLGVTANEPGEMMFKAYATGRFSITSHGFGEQKDKGKKHRHGALFYLEVHPN